MSQRLAEPAGCITMPMRCSGIGMDSIVEQAGVPILVLGLNGSVDYVNAAFESMSGYAKDEVIGAHREMLNGGGYGTDILTRLGESTEEVGEWKGEIGMRGKSGVTFRVRSTITRILDHNGRVEHYVEVLQPNVPEMKAFEEVRRLEKLEALGTLAGGVAHDFNNVLTAIQAFAHLALDLNQMGAERSRVGAKISSVIETSTRAQKLIDQILEFDCSSEEVPETIEIRSILDETLQMLSSTLDAGVAVWKEMDDRPRYVRAKAPSIQQIVLNLCTNAAQALSDHGGIITVSVSDFEVEECDPAAPTECAPGLYHRISVSDEGCGMDADTQRRIFDPFFTTKRKGTGLGMSTVRRIVSELNGCLTLKSELGAGTTVDLLLPARDQVAGPDSALSQSGIVDRFDDTSSGPKHRILYVDDEPGLILAGVETMELMGFRVVGMERPDEALRIFNTRPDAFDIVITDYAMPKLNGCRFARELRRIRPDVPVILLTAAAKGIEFKDEPPPEFDLVLLKPISYKDVADRVREVMESRNRDRTALVS